MSIYRLKLQEKYLTKNHWFTLFVSSRTCCNVDFYKF